MRSLRTLFVAPAIAALAGCGGARTEADLGAAFARIQIEEARIEHASADPDCPEVSRAADDLCAIAHEIEDRDALTRCERARRRSGACPAASESE